MGPDGTHWNRVGRAALPRRSARWSHKWGGLSGHPVGGTPVKTPCLGGPITTITAPGPGSHTGNHQH
jgi:hypothetical protein